MNNDDYAKLPAFDERMAARIRSGKYTRWAQDMDRATLYGTIWFVGELACRSDGGKQFAKEHWPTHYNHVNMRQHVALEVLGQIYLGHGLNDMSIKAIRHRLYAGMRVRSWDGHIIDHSGDAE